jgi:hypothetical protein
MQEDYESKLNALVEFGLNKSSCVLFIGPEFIKFNGKDCHLAFYDTLPDIDDVNVDKKKVRYDANEKIWYFDSKKIQREYYSKFAEFLEKTRDINNPVFHKLASIPFPLIVSLIPDDTLNAAFSQYKDFTFSFKSFMLDNEVPEPSREHLLIYNIYGNILNKTYVASHVDYLNFIMEYAKEDFPKNFKTAIRKAIYLVFIGFEFDKWYNILLLYILNIINNNCVEKYAVEEQSAEELYKKLSDSDLNLFFIEKNSEQFIDDLYKNKNIALREILPQKEYMMKMVKSIQETIDKIKDRFSYCDPMEQHKLQLDMGILEKDMNEFSNRLKEMQK